MTENHASAATVDGREDMTDPGHKDGKCSMKKMKDLGCTANPMAEIR